MNLQQLETFRSVAEAGSFTRAAERLGTTQSTVSMRIAELEQELGVRVLDRARGRVRVTPRGRDLLRYVTEILGTLSALKADLGGADTLSGSLRIGVAEVIALTWLPRLVADLSRRHPQIGIEMEIGLSGGMREKLGAGQIDLFLLPLERHPGAGFTTTYLGEVDFAFMVAPDLGLPDRTLSASDLAALPLISLGPNATLSAIEDRWFRKRVSGPVRTVRSNSMEISAGLVRSGLGFSLLPRDFYRADIAAGRLVPLAVSPPLRPVSFYAVHAEDQASPLVRTVLEIATKVSDFRKVGRGRRGLRRS